MNGQFLPKYQSRSPWQGSSDPGKTAHTETACTSPAQYKSKAKQSRKLKSPRSTGQAPEMNANNFLWKAWEFLQLSEYPVLETATSAFSLARHEPSFTPLAVVCKGVPKGPWHNPQPGCWLGQHLWCFGLLGTTEEIVKIQIYKVPSLAPILHDWKQSALHTTALNPLRAADTIPAKVHGFIKK